MLPGVGLSGGFRVVAEYAKRLDAMGHEVVLVARGKRPRSVRSRLRGALQAMARGRWPHPEVDDVGLGHFADPALEVRVIEGYRPIGGGDVPDADVVVATWWETAEWVAALPASKGAKAYFVQGFEVWAPQPEGRVRATWRLPLRKVVVSKWLADLAREEFGDASAMVVHNAVDTTLFTAPPRGKQATPTVGFIYSEVEIKGGDVAIRALERVRERVPGVRVVSFGMEPPSGLVPLPGWVDFVRRPAQGEIVRRYGMCDVWLFTSRSEGFGLPVVEAMACRTPVVGTPVGAAPELIGPGGGVLVPVDDAGAMADAVVRVLAMADDSWRRMSDAAYATARTLSWDEAARRFEAALAEIVRR